MDTTTNNNAQYVALADAVRAVSAEATSGMQSFADAQTARTARLTAVRDRLQSNSKTPPATLAKLNAAITAAGAIAQSTGSLSARIAARPAADPADLAVFGHVTDASGAAVAGVYARLSDSAGSLKAGSRVKTDAAGDFSLLLKACELPAGTQGLLVAVEDAAGARLTASNAITPKAGSTVYVDLALPAPTPTPDPKPTPTPTPAPDPDCKPESDQDRSTKPA